MADENVIEVKLRQKGTKGAAKSLRKKDIIPGVIYGQGKAPSLVSIERFQLKHYLERNAGATPIIDVHLEDSDNPRKKVAIKEVQRDPLKDKIIHIDLYEFSMDEPISIDVPVRLRNTPAGVLDGTGLLQFVGRQIEVHALPDQVPRFIDVDVAELQMAESITVADIRDHYSDVRIDEEDGKVIATVISLKRVKAAEDAMLAEGEKEAEGEEEGEEETDEDND